MSSVKKNARNEKNDCMLIFPPFAHVLYKRIYPSIPVLASVLKKHKFSSIQYEMNNEIIDWFFKSQYYLDNVQHWEKLVENYEKKKKLSSTDYETYLYSKSVLTNDIVLKRQKQSNERAAHSLLELILPKTTSSINDEYILNEIDKKDDITCVLNKYLDDNFDITSLDRSLMVGISIPIVTQLKPAVYLAKWIRKKVGDIPIYFGGPQCTLLEDDAKVKIIKSSGINGIVSREGEDAIVELAKMHSKGRVDYDKVCNMRYVRKKSLNKSLIRQKGNLNSFPTPYYDKENLRKWNVNELTVIVSRGCVWRKCAFCDYHGLYGKRMLRSPNKIVNDIKCLIKRHGRLHYAFSCETVEPHHIKKICEEVVRQKINIKWHSFMRLDESFSTRLLYLMKKSGAYDLQIGVDSLDDNILKKVRKGYDSKKAIAILNRISKVGLQFCVFMIVNLPGTTYSSAKRQLSKLKKLVIDSWRINKDWKLWTPRCSVYGSGYMLLKNAAIGRAPAKYGLQVIDSNMTKTQFNCCAYNQMQYKDINGMTKKECEKMLSEYTKLSHSQRMKINKNIIRSSLKNLNDDTMLYRANDNALIKLRFSDLKNNDYHERLKKPLDAICFSPSGNIRLLEGECSDAIKDILALLPMRYGEIQDEIIKLMRVKRVEAKKIIKELIRNIILITDVPSSHLAPY